MSDFQSYSQAGQDRFIYELLVKRAGIQQGTFLDIGCGHPSSYNNSFALERLGWLGLLVDIHEDPELRANRTSPITIGDACSIEWSG